MERVVPWVIDYRPCRQFVPFHARWQRVVTPQLLAKSRAPIARMEYRSTDFAVVTCAPD
jgi:hypothetical protein